MNIPNACIDNVPVHQVYPYEPAGTDTQEIPRKILLDVTSILDQSLQPETKMACIVYSLTHTKHEQEKVATLDPRQEWSEALDHGADVDAGWSMNGGLVFYKGKYYISAYANAAKEIDKMKTAIAQGQPIFTGSNRINRTATKKHALKVAQIVKSGAGHAICANGYDDDFEDGTGRKGAFHFKNSYKDFPEFWVMYDDVKYLYSTIVLVIDQSLAENLKRVQNAKLIMEAMKAGITNGKELDQYCTRKQLAVMIGRALYGPELSDAQYAEKTYTDKIWNKERGTDFVLRFEAMVMVARMALKLQNKSTVLKDHQYIQYLIDSGISNAGRQSERATREEGVLLVARGIK